eukprot:m.118808 g.118808  ORF g.118808 m.118808 type:complete len:60 (+) comp17223_c0_seq11:1146-1325(+)
MPRDLPTCTISTPTQTTIQQQRSKQVSPLFLDLLNIYETLWIKHNFLAFTCEDCSHREL